MLFLRYSFTSSEVGASVSVFLFSNAHCCLAPSIWRRLLIQAFCWAVLRARTKFGIAIAANRPIMATTIMISTSVKPDLRRLFFFILSFLFYGVNLATGGLVLLLQQVFTYCPLPTVKTFLSLKPQLATSFNNTNTICCG